MKFFNMAVIRNTGKNLPQWEDFPPEVLKDEYQSVNVEDIFITLNCDSRFQRLKGCTTRRRSSQITGRLVVAKRRFERNYINQTHKLKTR
ncbi:hypothetical protein NIO16_004886 [Salmonella enterica]|nr:hypothetical protein [Salmonella enterica]